MTLATLARTFEPSLERGRFLDRSVHEDLLGSLRHIAEATVQTPIPHVLAPVLARLERGQRLPPEAFGLYFELGQRLLERDVVRAIGAATLLARCEPRRGGLRVMARGSEQAAGLDSVFNLRLGREAEVFAPVTHEEAEGFAVRLHEGLELLRQGLPGLHGEITAFLSHVIVAQAPQGAAMEFDGASHYQFWGLLLLNPRHHRNRLAVAEVLAHESGHSILFGMTRDEPLVYNPDDELFVSPLRVDPRPMDGILHATYVSARMAWTMEALADSGVLTPEEEAQARAAAQTDRENFHKGLGTVRAHGQLSGLGQAVIDAAEQWMEATSAQAAVS